MEQKKRDGVGTVLIVDDEKTIVDILAFNLKNEGFDVLEAYDGDTGLALALSGQCDLVLLDVMLPGLDGFTVLQRVRAHSDVPIIMLTAREEEQDKVFGLENGADDYIAKPFSKRELIARVRANIRRHAAAAPAAQPPKNTGSFGPFTIDRALQQAYKDGVLLELSQREYDILCYCIDAAGRVIGREEFLQKVWGYDYYGDLHTVDVAIRRLRAKIEENPAKPRHLITKHGAGYYLQKD